MKLKFYTVNNSKNKLKNGFKAVLNSSHTKDG